MFGLAERVADAVLYEGNVVDPYAASASKNRLRWQFGIVAPQAPRDHGEPSLAQTECLIGADSRHSTVSSRRLWVRVRCLRPRPGTTDTARPWLQGGPTAIDALVAMPLDRLPLERDVALT